MCGGKNRDHLYTLLLMLADGIVVYAILCGALYLYYLCGAKYSMRVALRLFYVPFIVLTINSFSRLYGGSFFYPGLGVNRVEELKRLTIGIFFSYVILFSYLGVTHTMVRFSRLALTVGMLLTMLVLPFVRQEVFPWLCRRFDLFRKRVLIIGAGTVGKDVAESIEHSPYLNVQVAGFVDDRATGPNILGKLDDCAAVAAKYDLSYAVLCLPEPERQKRTRDLLKIFHHLLYIPGSRLLPILRSYPVVIGGFGGFEISNRLKMRAYRCGKTITEVLLAVIVLPFILPVGLLIGLLVKLTSRGPILYRARRLGLHGRPISVFKFRTMYQDADAMLEQMLEENPKMKKEWHERFKLSRDPRVTPLGHFLRKTSLDELPQFLNVIRGEMAIIGPRPIVTNEVEYYGENFSVFSMVKPGITGLWQISGRSNTTYDARVKLDVYYCLNWSIWLDYYILMKTILVVLLRKGAE